MVDCYIVQYRDHAPLGRAIEPSYFAVDGEGNKVSPTMATLGTLVFELRSRGLQPGNLNGHHLPAGVIDRFCTRFGEIYRPRLGDIGSEERRSLDEKLKRH